MVGRGGGVNVAANPDWTAARERSNVIALRTIVWIATHLGRRVARWVLHPITLYFLVFAPGPRRQSARYLARVLGRPPGWADRYRHLHAFASVALDRIWFAGGHLEQFDLHIDGAEIVDTAMTEGRGAFLLGAHIGSFEALHAVGISRHGMRVAMVMYPDNARMIHGVLQAIEPDFELGIIPIGQRGSALAIRDWLDSGGLTGLLGDRFIPSVDTQSRSLECNFLGVPAQFSDGPLRMAMMLRRQVVFMVGLYRGGNRYDVRFETLADFRTPPDTAPERERLVHDAIRRYVQMLESLCREAPTNWFNFYDFWREDKAA